MKHKTKGTAFHTAKTVKQSDKLIISAKVHFAMLKRLAPRTATLVVAAADASAASQARADYVCHGIADDVEIQAAIDSLPA